MIRLVGHELVAHVFLPAGTGRDEDRDRILDLWDACAHEYSLGEQVAGHPPDLPDAAALPTATGLVAARAAAGPGATAMVLRRGSPDAFVLSVQVAPDAAEARTWTGLERGWAGVAPSRAGWLVGSAVLLVARADCIDMDPAVIEPAVRADVEPGSLHSPVDLRGTGVRRAADPLGPFAVWEALRHDDAGPLRRHRRLVVVGPELRERELSAWVWQGRPADPAPLARYLGEAADARRLVSTRRQVDVGALLRRVHITTQGVRALVDDPGPAGARSGPTDLVAALRPVQRFQTAIVDLADEAGGLRDLQRRLDIARTNLAALRGDEPDAPNGRGPFSDDQRFTETAAMQADHDAAFLEAAADRARDVASVADQVVQRGLGRRQEQVNAFLTGVVGALLMGLAAIQALQFRLALPPQAEGPAIATVTAIALLVPMIVVRVSGPRPARAVDVGLGIGIGALAGSALWWVRAISGTVAFWPQIPTIGAAVAGLAVLALRLRTR